MITNEHRRGVPGQGPPHPKRYRLDDRTRRGDELVSPLIVIALAEDLIGQIQNVTRVRGEPRPHRP